MCESIDACPPRLDSSLAKSTLAVWIAVDAQTTLGRRWMLRRNGLDHYSTLILGKAFLGSVNHNIFIALALFIMDYGV